MENELFDTKLKEYQAQIPSVTNKAIISIENIHQADELETKVKQLSVSLRTQIMDPANAGFGERAQSIFSEIEQLLGTSLTIYKGSPQNVADKMDLQIAQIMEAKVQSMSKSGDLVVEKITTIQTSSDTLISNALASAEGDEKRIALASAEESYNRIGELTRSIDEAFAFTPMAAEHLELGKISHSFYSGFVKKDNPQAALIATLASLAIDFLVPIFILLVYGGSAVANTSGRNTYARRRSQIEIV
jgi:hypothetical protein